MSLIDHARKEFEILGWPGSDPMQKTICNNLERLLEVFAAQGHSGFSASYVLTYFNKLVNFDTIAPLTGKESEWNEVGDDMYQNNRNSEVFKQGKDGQAYWINGKIFRGVKGDTWTNGNSCVDVTFPWDKPEPEYVDVPEDLEETHEERLRNSN